MQLRKLNSQGFTLVEILSVLVLLGILVAIAAPRFINLSKEVKLKAALAGVAEYNGREKIIWTRVQLIGGDTLSSDIAVDDAVFQQMDFNLDSGSDDDWGFAQAGGAAGSEISATLTFKGEDLSIVRTPATLLSPAVWSASGGSASTQDPKENLLSNMEYIVGLLDDFRSTGGTPSTWGDQRYTQLGLDQDTWDESPVDHVIYNLRGTRVGIKPEEGYQMVVTMAGDGSEQVLTEKLNWNIWYNTQDDVWYLKDIAAGNEILIDSLQILEE